MIKVITVTNSKGWALALDLWASQAASGLTIFNIEGLGSPKAVINGQGGPNVPGTKFTSASIDPRHITMTIANSRQLNPGETALDTLYTRLPIGEKITFKIETYDNIAYAEGYVESFEVNHFAKVENAVIGIYFPFPYWLENTEQTYNIVNTGSGTNLSYTGHKSTGFTIIITFTGNVTDITFTNDNPVGGQSLFIDTSVIVDTYSLSAIQSGDVITINTRIGEKSITLRRSSVDYNIMNCIGLFEDWIQLHYGANNIDWSAVSGEGNMTVQGKFRRVWMGV